jgi:hypothetical protein
VNIDPEKLQQIERRSSAVFFFRKQLVTLMRLNLQQVPGQFGFATKVQSYKESLFFWIGRKRKTWVGLSNQKDSHF